MTRRNAFKLIPIKMIDLMFVQIVIPGLKLWRLYTQELQTHVVFFLIRRIIANVFVKMASASLSNEI